MARADRSLLTELLLPLDELEEGVYELRAPIRETWIPEAVRSRCTTTSIASATR